MAKNSALFLTSRSCGLRTEEWLSWLVWLQIVRELLKASRGSNVCAQHGSLVQVLVGRVPVAAPPLLTECSVFSIAQFQRAA